MSHTEGVFDSQFNRTDNVRLFCGLLYRAGLLSSARAAFFLSFSLPMRHRVPSVPSVRSASN